MSSPSVRLRNYQNSQIDKYSINPFFMAYTPIIQKTESEIKQAKKDELIKQLIELSDAEDKEFLSNQIIKLLDNPYQTRKTDRQEFTININKDETESEVKRMTDLINKVKQMRG